MISLSQLEQTLTHNIHAAPEPSPLRFKEFSRQREFEWEEKQFLDLAQGAGLFRHSLEEMYRTRQLQHPSVEAIRGISLFICRGMERAAEAYREWKQDPTLMDWIFRRKTTEITKSYLRDILKFPSYAGAHIALRDHTTEFGEMCRQSKIQFVPLDHFMVGRYDSERPLPELDAGNLIIVSHNFIGAIAQAASTECRYQPYMATEGPFYTV